MRTTTKTSEKSKTRIERIEFIINKKLKLCQTERKRRVTRWLPTSVRRDCARIVIRASKTH